MNFPAARVRLTCPSCLSVLFIRLVYPPWVKVEVEVEVEVGLWAD